jgi:outer membrane protein assembly factor BamD (BamD/ComL family)
MHQIYAQRLLTPARLAVGFVLLLSIALFVGSSVASTNTTDANSFRATPVSEHYEHALSLIEARDYTQALRLLRQIQAYYPGFKKLSAVQTRIAVLQEAQDAGNALSHYLSALDSRDAGDIDSALATLDFMAVQYKDNTLADDTLYLKAYLQIMDRYDFEAAQETLAELERLHPESSYQDSAAYLEAITLEQLGETELAKSALENLRDRHTALALPFGFNWPEGNILSRYWFERADKRLHILEKRTAESSQLQSVQSSKDQLLVDVSIDGIDFKLNLSPSPLVRKTDWRDGVLQDTSPPAAGVYVGKVIGDDDSWVRAVIINDTISGAVYAYDQKYYMQPGTLMGTLDYYQPRSAKTRSASQPDSVSTEAIMTYDSIRAPALGGAVLGMRSASKPSDLRVVPVSIVIDSEFDRYYGGTGLVTALNQLNIADGVYRQFGIALAVDEVQVFGDDEVNPMLSAPATLEQYLYSFRTYRLDNRTLFSDSALTYLFTGKQRTDRTLGLAWIDTLCRVDGYDVGITTPSSIGGVLLAHEMGHSLGAQHDTDTSCKDDSTKLMWPHISARTNTEFSSCSNASVSNARTKSCLIDAVDLALQMNGGVDAVNFELSNLDSAVAMNAKLSIDTTVASLFNWPAGCQRITPTSGECIINQLGPGEQRSISIDVMNADAASDAVVSAQLSPIGTQDFSPFNNQVSFVVGTGTSVSPVADVQTYIPQNRTPAAAKGSASIYWVLLLGVYAFRVKRA